MKMLVVLAGLLAVASCAPAPPGYQMITPFNEADFAAWRSGPASIHGQAFLKTVGGDVKTCAGALVVIYPGNAYGEEMLRADRARHIRTDKPPGLAAYVHSTRCDAQGNFTFSGLAALPWVIVTVVEWGVPTGSTLFPIDTQGGLLTQETTLKPGDNPILLTAADQ